MKDISFYTSPKILTFSYTGKLTCYNTFKIWLETWKGLVMTPWFTYILITVTLLFTSVTNTIWDLQHIVGNYCKSKYFPSPVPAINPVIRTLQFSCFEQNFWKLTDTFHPRAPFLPSPTPILYPSNPYYEHKCMDKVLPFWGLSTFAWKFRQICLENITNLPPKSSFSASMGPLFLGCTYTYEISSIN